MAYNSYCLSSYLAFRYVAKKGEAWKDGVEPAFPVIEPKKQTSVGTSEDISQRLRKSLEAHSRENTAILLSGGIDSAILAALLPKGTRAYTIRFLAENAVDESVQAAEFAERCDSTHEIVDVTWDDYPAHMDELMLRKHSPLHAIEVALFKAAKQARNDGIDTLIVGNGADSTFGGMDKLLSRDWTFDAFVKRYSFLDPATILKQPVSILEAYETYRRGDHIDVQGFLKNVHGLGIIQTFENAIHAGGCEVVAPYEALKLDGPLDLARVRGGEPKYLLRRVFEDLFKGFSIPDKIPFPRPMDDWLRAWSGPNRPEFLDPLSIDSFTGDQKWLIYCLERFLGVFEQ